MDDKDQTELAQRVAVVRRFKKLLEQQAGRLRNYIGLLERQEAAIGSGSGDQILAQVESEERFVAEIISLQRVIIPLEEMYSAVSSDDGIPALKAALEGMKAEAQAQSAKNRELLRARMAVVRADADAMRKNPIVRSARSAYGVAAPSFVHLKG